ncbi:MAG: hypothetical protein IJ429_02425 [Lachnospiraceae bacterium]|nr:hypothetical protein [Lachnospiraceae bacterium]
MKNWIKGIIFAILACAAVYLIPCFVLWNRFLDLPNTQSVPLITDYSLKDEKTYKLEKTNLEVSVPTYYTRCQEIKEFSAYVCDSREKNKQLLIIYQPFNQVADKIMPGFSETYDDLMDNFYDAELPFPISLTHEFPNDIFEGMKEIYTKDKNDYNFWDPNESLYLYHCLTARIEAEKKASVTVHSMYERDNVRAIVATNKNEPGTYVALIIPNSNTGNIYAIIIQTSDPNDITKILNTYEFK